VSCRGEARVTMEASPGATDRLCAGPPVAAAAGSRSIPGMGCAVKGKTARLPRPDGRAPICGKPQGALAAPRCLGLGLPKERCFSGIAEQTEAESSKMLER